MFLLLFLASCNEDAKQPGCNFDDPLEEIQWLKEIKENMERSAQAAGSSIKMYTYKGARVFEVNACVGCPDNLVQVYNCDGEVICEFGGIAGVNTCEDFATEATDPVLLYSSSCDKVTLIDPDLYKTESDFFNLISARISGNCLMVEYSSSGCSGDSWDMKLVDAGEILESFPVQRNIKLILKNEEACQAVFTKTISFDLTPLQLDMYSEIILNLDGKDESLFYVYDPQNLSILSKTWSLVKVEGGLLGQEFTFDSGLIKWSFDGQKIVVVNGNTDETKEDSFSSGSYDFEIVAESDGWSLKVGGENLGNLQINNVGEFQLDARSFDGYRMIFRSLQ